MNNNNRAAESSGGFTLGDVYFAIFRHKWKIIIICLASVVAAAVVYLLNPPIYQSEAQLFIRYITDIRPVIAQVDNSTLNSVGGGVMNAEISILQSFDLAKQVAATIGPEKILAKSGGGKDLLTAAAVVRSGLVASAAPNSSVLNIMFVHADPAIVQPVLNEVIADYMGMHTEIHGSLGSDDFAADETTQLRLQIAATERELMAAKTNAGIISLEDSQDSVAKQIDVVRGQLLTVELELQTRREMMGRSGAVPSVSKPASATNVVSAAEIPDELTDQYNRVCTRFAVLQRKSAEFVALGYSEDNVLNKEVNAQIIQTRNLKKKLEEENPGLASLGAATLAMSGQSAAGVEDGPAQLALLESREKILNLKLNDLRAELLRVGEFEPKIKDLTRKQQQQENSLTYFTKSLEGAKINESLGAGKITGIKAIQQPTPPHATDSKRLKTAGMVLGGGIFTALALAFLIEMVLDRSIKRAVEIETKLKIPLFLSIPDVSRNGARKRWSRAAKAEIGNSMKTGEPTLEIAPWSTNHSLRSFYEALRDRIVVYFDVKNVVHNPKLVAVTSANRGAGVTTMAMGLAASLSETGEGNVLLVDMNAEQGAVHQFYKGKPGCHLDDAFVKEKRGGALMQDNLYVVSERSQGDKLPRILPKRFNTLLPKFKASDYDYIIFDMPPVTQTSVTPRLSGFMDMVLLVVEAEKTDQEVVRRANSLLKESKANVIAVLNKTRKYVPEKLHQEYLSDS